jgi:hypothetical protein
VRLPARRDLILGGFVATVAIAYALDFSFAAPFLNFLIVLIALGAGGALVLALFGIGPRWLGIPLGLLGIGGWMLACLWIVVLAAFDGDAPLDADLGGGLLCRRTVYGFVGSDSGHELAIYRRTAFVDHRLYYERRSEIYRNDPLPVPPYLHDAVSRCRRRPAPM